MTAQVKPHRDPERELVICSLFSGGMNMSSIAEIYGVSPERIRQIVRRNGLSPMGPGRINGMHTDPIQIVDALKRARSYQHAARLADGAVGMVMRLVREMGLEPEAKEWFAANLAADHRRRVTAKRDALLLRMRVLAERLGRTPTKTDLDQYAKGTAQYQNAFGSLRNAQAAAGLRTYGRGRRPIERQTAIA